MIPNMARIDSSCSSLASSALTSSKVMIVGAMVLTFSSPQGGYLRKKKLKGVLAIEEVEELRRRVLRPSTLLLLGEKKNY